MYANVIFANRSQNFIPIIIHKSQDGFVFRKKILLNIIDVYMGRYWAQWQVVNLREKNLVELDLENAYGNVNWPFAKVLMFHLGFG